MTSSKSSRNEKLEPRSTSFSPKESPLPFSLSLSLPFVEKCIFRSRRTLTTTLFQKQIYSVSACIQQQQIYFEVSRSHLYVYMQRVEQYSVVFLENRSITWVMNNDVIHVKLSAIFFAN